jgi:hypothetical protein
MDEPVVGTHQLSAPPVCLQLRSELWAGTIGGGIDHVCMPTVPSCGATPATLRRMTVVRILEEGRDAGHREDTVHGVATVHE